MVTIALFRAPRVVVETEAAIFYDQFVVIGELGVDQKGRCQRIIGFWWYIEKCELGGTIYRAHGMLAWE